MFELKGRIEIDVDDDGPRVSWVDVYSIIFSEDDGTCLEGIAGLMEMLNENGGWIDEELMRQWNDISQNREYDIIVKGSFRLNQYIIEFS